MMDDERDGLLARIRQVRLATVRDRPHGDPEDPQAERLRAVEARLAHLERLVEGLQDSVHRESERHARLIAELKTQVQPGAIGTSLADDARHRGL